MQKKCIKFFILPYLSTGAAFDYISQTGMGQDERFHQKLSAAGFTSTNTGSAIFYNT
jgi:hypothetical protein